MGVDDELLALAGDADSDSDARRSASPPSKSKKRGASSAAARKSSKKKRKEAAHSEDENDEEPNPFPLEGIFKDEEDRERLLGLSELQREDILSRRRDEQQKRAQKAQLAAMVRSQRAAGASTAKRGSRRQGSSSGSSAADSDIDGSDYDSREVMGVAGAAKGRARATVGSSATKSAKLSELRNKRANKRAGASTRRAGSPDDSGSPRKRAGSDDSDVYESSSDAESEDGRYHRSRKVSAIHERERDERDSPAEPPSLTELNRTRLTRTDIEKHMYWPGFEKALLGSWVRYCIGEARDQQTGRSVSKYRICEIIGLADAPTYSLFGGCQTKLMLVLRHGHAEREQHPSKVSNSPFTQEEYDRWVRTVLAERAKHSSVKFPRRKDLEAKQDEIEAYLEYRLNEDDVNKLVSAKKAAQAEANAQRSSSSGGRGTYDDPRPSAARLEAASQEAGVGGAGSTHMQQHSHDQRSLGDFNARARAEDRIRVQAAEKRAAALKRANMGRAAQLKAEAEAGANGNESGTPTTPGTPGKAAVGTPTNGSATASPALGPVPSVNAVALDIEVDLGEF